MINAQPFTATSFKGQERKSRARLSGRRATIVLGLMVVACAPAGVAGTSGSRTYSSQQAADLALTAFGADNRACRMWTNWQSLCSRTGPGGSAYCKKDPGFAVEPSEPFCVSRQIPPGTTDQAQFDTPGQRRSRNRFCDLFVGQPGSMRGPAGSTPECELYAAERPFDGRRPEAVAHPLCRQWRVVPPNREAAPGAPLGPAACVEWENPLPCHRVQGNAYRYPDKNTIMMPTIRDYRGRPVWGVYCIEEDTVGVKKLGERFPGPSILNETEFSNTILGP